MTNTAQMAMRRTTSTTRRGETAGAGPDAPRRARASRSGAPEGRAVEPPRSGSAGGPERVRHRSGWLATAVAALLIVAGGAAVSIGPYRDYQDASSRLTEQQEQVAVLEQENQALQADVQRLQRPSYLEGLARRDLNLGRPGEKIFVVEGIPSGSAAGTDEQPESQPGPLERLVERLRSFW